MLKDAITEMRDNEISMSRSNPRDDGIVEYSAMAMAHMKLWVFAGRIGSQVVAVDLLNKFPDMMCPCQIAGKNLQIYNDFW